MAPRKLPPKLPIAVFQTANSLASSSLAESRVYPSSLIDAHVHLWDAPLAESISWLKGDALGKSGDLGYERWKDCVREVGEGLPKGSGEGVEGFVFVQVEVDHDDADIDGSKGGRDAAINEVAWISQHVASDSNPRLYSIVPWAPLPHGPSAVTTYLSRLPSSSIPLISSFRYLLQFPVAPGTMLKDPFVQGLKWLGGKGWGFEVTIDCKWEGAERLAEVVECVTKVREGQEKGMQTKFMICHLGKPDLSISPSPRDPSPSSFHALFISSLFQLSLLPHLSLKLSGLLSCSPPSLVRSAFAYYKSVQRVKEGVKSPTRARAEAVQGEEGPREERKGDEKEEREAYKELKKSIKVYLEPALEAFGDHRLVYGSDFPMYHVVLCNTGKPDPADEAAAYAFQFNVVRECLVELGVRDSGLDNVFFANARAWYTPPSQ